MFIDCSTISIISKFTVLNSNSDNYFYFQFQHVPLYLEWAPTEALKPLNQVKEDEPADKKEEDPSQVSQKKW